MWRKALAIFIGGFLVVLLLSTAYLKSQSFMTMAVQSLSAEAAAFLGTTVEIDDLSLHGPQTIRAGNIAVYDQSGERLFKADGVQIGFSLWSALSGLSVVECVDIVEIERPEIFIYRHKTGGWNYEDIIPESDGSPSPFYGKVKLRDATIRVGIDDNVIPLEQVQAELDFAAQPAVAFVADFKRGAGLAKVSGSFGGKHMACSVKAEGVDVADYLDLLPPEMAFKVQSGTLKSVDVTVLEEPSGYRVDGEALVLGLGLQVADMQIKDIDGLVLFDEKHLRLFSRGKVKEEPIVLRGKISLDVVEPVLDLQVSSPKLQLEKVLEKSPVKGAVSFKANVYGKYKEPVIDAVIRMNEAAAYGHALKGIESKLSYENDKVIVESLKGAVAGGTFSGSGVFNIRTEDYQLKIQASQLPADVLTGGAFPLRGDLSADLALAGSGIDLKKALVYGNAQLEKGSYQDIGFDHLSVSFYQAEDKIILDTLLLALPQGMVSGKGELAGDQLAFEYQGSQVDLSELNKLDRRIALKGLADFSGSARGTLTNPELTMALEAKDGDAWQQPYQQARAAVSLKDHRLHVEQLTLTDGAQRHSATGTMALQGDRALDFRVDSAAVRAENLMKLVKLDGVTGNVNHTVQITGTLDSPVLKGQLDFYEGSAYDMLVAKITGDYLWENNKLFLNDFVVSSPNIDVHLSGTMDQNQELDFAIAAQNIDFSKIHLNLPYPVAGTASFVGRLVGAAESPVFKGQLMSDQLAFNGRCLNDIQGEIVYRNNKLELPAISFNQGKGKFKLSGDFAVDSKRVNGKLTADDGTLGDILAVANVQSGWIDGELDGEVILSGTVADPYIQLSGVVNNGNLRGYPLNNLEINLSADKQQVNLKKFRAVEGDSLLVGQGTMNLDGAIALEFSGNAIDADLFAHLAGYDVPAKGRLDFGAKVTGQTNNPDVELSFDIQGGGIGTASFDSLYGLFRLEDSIIQIEQLLAKKANYKASAYGVIPLQAINSDWEANVDLKNQMDLRISLDQADLSILPFLTPEIEWAVGPTTGSIDVRGTLDKPLFYGNVAVHDGALKFKSLGKPLQNFEFHMDFLGDKIKLQRFEGVMGKGSYQMTGESFVTGTGLHQYRLVLDLNHLEINNKYYTGPLEGQLVLEEDTLRDKLVPKLSGALTFADCVFDIPPIPENEEQMPLVKLDLNIALDKKVRLYNSFLYDIVLEGAANFSGNTRRPQASGEFNAVRGTIYYLKTPFQIREAGAYFNQVGSFLPSLHVEADTRLQRTKVSMQVSGPADNMKVRLTSNPEMNESEILSLLTLRSRYYSGEGSGLGKEDLKALIGIGLQMSFLSEAENMMRNVLGLDELQIVRDTLSNRGANESDEVYNLEVGKYISDKVMLRYAGGIDHNSYKYGIRYEFNNQISMSGNLDEDNEASFSVEARFKF